MGIFLPLPLQASPQKEAHFELDKVQHPAKMEALRQAVCFCNRGSCHLVATSPPLTLDIGADIAFGSEIGLTALLISTWGPKSRNVSERPASLSGGGSNPPRYRYGLRPQQVRLFRGADGPEPPNQLRTLSSRGEPQGAAKFQRLIVSV